MILIAPDQLSDSALNGLIEEFVSRSGRNHDQAEFSVYDMAEQIKEQLKAGELQIVFDPESATASIVKAP